MGNDFFFFLSLLCSLKLQWLSLFYILTSDHISNQHFFCKNCMFGQAFHGKILPFKIAMSGRWGVVQGLPFG